MPSALALDVVDSAVTQVGPGRPTLLTPALTLDICQLVRAGKTVPQLCALLQIGQTSFYDWQAFNRDFAEAIAQARAQSAHALADRVHEVAESAFANPGERSELANGARVCLGSLQWLAAKRNPAAYAERSALAIDARITVAGETPLTYAEVMAARATRGARAAAVREERAREGASGANSLDAAGAQAGGAVDVAASVAASVAAAGGEVPPGA